MFIKRHVLAELAQLTKTVERMKEGFDTMVGERGAQLGFFFFFFLVKAYMHAARLRALL